MDTFIYQTIKKTLLTTKYIKDIEKIWRKYDCLASNLTSMNEYKLMYKILTLCQKLIREKSNKSMPEFLNNTIEHISRKIIVGLKSSDYDSFIDTYKYSEHVSLPRRSYLKKVTTFIELVGNKALPYSYNYIYMSGAEIRASKLKDELQELIEWRNLDYKNRKNYTVLKQRINYIVKNLVEHKRDIDYKQHEDFYNARAKAVKDINKHIDQYKKTLTIF